MVDFVIVVIGGFVFGLLLGFQLGRIYGIAEGKVDALIDLTERISKKIQNLKEDEQ